MDTGQLQQQALWWTLDNPSERLLESGYNLYCGVMVDPKLG
jgi:hypothetical protein